jgi:tetratricopeptide (TPR) repeat protein
VEAFRAGLALFPQDEELWVRYAQTLDGLGDFKEAGNAYREAVNLDPNLGVLRSYYSRHLQKVGREAEAEEQKKLASEASQKNLAPVPLHRSLSEPEHPDEQTNGPAE